jgi:membrane-associated phospholipid phosphatase
VITAGVVGGALDPLDAAAAVWLHAHAIPMVTKAMIVVSFMGAPSTLTSVTLVIVFVLVRRHRYEDAVAWATVVLGGNLLNICLKELLHRGRPVFEDPILTLPTYSFPSGHAMAATVFYGLLAVYAANHAKDRFSRRAAIAAAALMIALVCFSRVYLGLHFASDVTAGVAEGVAWSAGSLALLQHVRARRKLSRDRV